MALNFINSGDSANSIQFVSSTDFSIGSPIYYKQIESSKNYTIAGSSGNKTITISASGYSNSTQNFYFNFSDPLIPSDNYLSTTFASGSVIISSVNTTATSAGTVNLFDYDLAYQTTNLTILPEYIISKKTSGTPNSYTAIKFGHINLPATTWDSLKQTNDGYYGLISSSSYYLSSTAGKITTTLNNYPLFKALSPNRAFVNLNYSIFNWNNGSSSWKNSDNIDLSTGKSYKINGSIVLDSTQVIGKTVPSGVANEIVGTSSSQNLTNKTINNLTYPTSDGLNGYQLVTNGSGTLSLENINFITDVNMTNTASGTLNFANYSYQANSFKITNPGSSMNFINGTPGKWYTVIIFSNGSYSFNSNCRFAIDNAQPIPSASGSVDAYSFFCLSSDKFLSTFAYGYNGVS
jgi:hypothetical protein